LFSFLIGVRTLCFQGATPSAAGARGTVVCFPSQVLFSLFFQDSGVTYPVFFISRVWYVYSSAVPLVFASVIRAWCCHAPWLLFNGFTHFFFFSTRDLNFSVFDWFVARGFRPSPAFFYASLCGAPSEKIRWLSPSPQPLFSCPPEVFIVPLLFCYRLWSSGANALSRFFFFPLLPSSRRSCEAGCPLVLVLLSLPSVSVLKGRLPYPPFTFTISLSLSSLVVFEFPASDSFPCAPCIFLGRPSSLCSPIAAGGLDPAP